jgi:hypothetical protein
MGRRRRFSTPMLAMVTALAPTVLIIAALARRDPAAAIRRIDSRRATKAVDGFWPVNGPRLSVADDVGERVS